MACGRRRRLRERLLIIACGCRLLPLACSRCLSFLMACGRCLSLLLMACGRCLSSSRVSVACKRARQGRHPRSVWASPAVRHLRTAFRRSRPRAEAARVRRPSPPPRGSRHVRHRVGCVSTWPACPGAQRHHGRPMLPRVPKYALAMRWCRKSSPGRYPRSSRCISRRTVRR